MADAALSLALEKLADFAIQKVHKLFHVGKQVKRLIDELQMMKCFLRDAAEKKAKDERIRKWISDIRQVAFDTEDVIESFILKVDDPWRRQPLLGRCASFPWHVYHLYQLGQEIKSIQKRLKDIDDRRARYAIESLHDEARMLSLDGIERKRLMSPWQPNKHVVGFEEDVKTLLREAIYIEKAGLSTASIVGMGGIGKSTLAKEVYNHALICEQFDRRAWVTVSGYFSPKEVLKKLLVELEPREGEPLTNTENLPEESLQKMVYQRLRGTRYFIVVDDVWREQDWEYIARAFPDEPDKASRLLITSRIHNIPRSAHYVHKLKCLDSHESWQLFLKVAFIDNGVGKCPPELEDIGRKIVDKCNGLPLAICVMGGLLSEQRESVSRWERVLKGIKSYLEVEEDSVSAILELSYSDLHPHVKSCFLHLSFFKEDELMTAQKMIELWIAEGIIPQGNREKTMEEIAMSCLDELIDRNLLQMFQLPTSAAIRFCYMHDLIRDLSIKKAMEEIYFDFLTDEDKASTESLDKARHLAIWCDSNSLMSSWNPNPHLRSLFLTELGDVDDCILSSFLKRLGGCIRVLELDGLGLKVVPKKIGSLVGLRYLGLIGNEIRKLPRSIGNLSNLQVLNISSINDGIEVPNVIWKLDRLRHLYFPEDMTCEEPLKLDTLKNLQTLEVSVENIVVNHLAELVSLRTLRIAINDVDVSRLLISLLAKLDDLVNIHIFNRSSMGLSPDGIVVLQHLTQLSISQKLVKLPDSFPQNLHYLYLSGAELNEDPMPILGKLQNLLHLILYMDFYVGENMRIARDGFPRLEVLFVEPARRLRQIYIETGGLPKLKELEIRGCVVLEILPREEEMRMIGNLQKLTIRRSNAIARKLEGGNYSHIISKIPSVVISED